MTIEPRLDIIGAALADQSRSRILCELMDGRAFTNKELASAARITPQTASAHLGHLATAGLTVSLRSGRCVYHRIATAEVAEVLERLALLSPTDHLFRTGRSGDDTRLARSCYDHVAGRIGVRMAERLVALDVLRIRQDAVQPGVRYQAFVDDVRLDVRPFGSTQPVAKLCLDWTERRHHLSGPLATAILQKSLDLKWLGRRVGSRALTVTPAGREAFDRWFGISEADLQDQ